MTNDIVQWQERLAQEAKDEAAKERPSVATFSLKAGVLSYNGQAMPNNEVDVIIAAHITERTYYINKYDPTNIVPPLCFAINDDKPHANSFKKQSDECSTCEKNEWGSDPDSPSGKGKACKEGRRLGLIPAAALSDLGKAEIGLMRLPATSGKGFADYIQRMAATSKRPVWTLITRIKVVSDPKTMIKVTFECVGKIDDGEIFTALQPVREQALRAISEPYQAMTEEQYKELTTEKPNKKRKF